MGIAGVTRQHAGLVLFIVAYYAAARTVATALGDVQGVPWHLNFFLVFILFGLTAHLVQALWVGWPRRPIPYLATFAGRFFTKERCLGAAIMLAVVPLHSVAFLIFKSMIPRINRFSWDEPLAAWDEALHFGHPWQHLQFLNTPAVTRFIDIAYIAFFPVVWAVLAWAIFCEPACPRRKRIIWTYVLTWFLLGNVAATLTSSMGPCYYDFAVRGANPYAEQMAYLAQVDQSSPLTAVYLQEHLLAGHMGEHVAFIRCISAMPSLHVAIAFFLVLATWSLNRLLRTVMLGYLVVVFLGSIHLGWHYALDGYAGIAGAWLIWVGVGATLARHHQRPPGAARRGRHWSAEDNHARAAGRRRVLDGGEEVACQTDPVLTLKAAETRDSEGRPGGTSPRRRIGAR